MSIPEIAIKPFNLLRWFSWLSLLIVIVVSASSALLLAQFLRENLLQRDAVVTQELVQSVAQALNTAAYFADRDYGKSKADLDNFFRQIAHLPDVVRANVYAADGTIIWSNQEQLIGQKFTDNGELSRSLAGALVLKTGQITAPEKSEHVLFEPNVDRFVENYIPIRDQDRVVGVVEVYKIPRVLSETIARGSRRVWVSAVLGGLLLYAGLFWVARRASRVIRQQQRALIEAEGLTVIGELTSSVAHNLRNPLAAIRSSAELGLLDISGPAKESIEEIVNEVDRLDQWVRELLLITRDDNTSARTAAVKSVITSALEHFGQRPEKTGVEVNVQMPESLPPVRANPDALVQVLISLVANALEAMPNGGRLAVQGRVSDEQVIVCITDTGEGIAELQPGGTARPLAGHKPGGLGIGLPLARRILQRYGAGLALSSRPGQGTTVQLSLLAAS